jgi:hypothetical protein
MAHHQEKHPAGDAVRPGHETSDANVKAVFYSGIGLSAGLMIFGLLLSWGIYTIYKSRTPDPGAPAKTFVVPDSTALPPLPRLQSDPHVALVPFLRAQDSVLASYGWVNKDSGIARIPIQRAMELIVKSGLPVQPGTAAK